VSVKVIPVSNLFHLRVNCLTPLDPVRSPPTVRTMTPVETSKMLIVSVTWVSVLLLGTHSSGEVSVMSTVIVPAGTPTPDVRVRMGSASLTSCGSVTSPWTVTS